MARAANRVSAGRSAAPVFKIVRPKHCAWAKCLKTCRRLSRTPLVARNAADLNDLAVSDLERLNEDLLADGEEDVAAAARGR
jgi:hypothetical protein